MWLLQHKNIHKKHLLWFKIIGLCLGFHLIILFWLFCVYKENKYMYAFSVNKTMDYSAPILFVPLGSPMPTKSISTIQKTTTIKVQTPKPAAKINKSEPKKTTTFAISPKIETKKEITAVKKQEDKPTTEVKKTIEPSLTKAMTDKPEKKIDKIKPSSLVKADMTENKSINKPENKVAQAIDIQQNIVPIATTSKATKSVEKNASQTRNIPQLPQNAHISHDFREVEALRRGAQLQKELVQKWQPPIGVSPDCTCDISFFVTQQGAIENLKMIKSSGVVMFDISARQALFAMKMPQWTHGKPLLISFKR